MLLHEIVDVSKLNKLSPKKGRVIISEPFMMDENFKRSVIFLCEHNEKGSFGFILNNILSATLSELVNGVNNNEFPISYGGPVHSDNLYYIHDLGDLIEDSQLLLPGLWSGGNFDQILTLINDGIIKTNNIRFFLGYSGWSENQLDNEMKSYSWITSDFKAQNILNQDKNLWKSILTQMGDKYEVISNFPSDPSQN